MDANRMPGDAEAAAAVEAMTEIYGRSLGGRKIGDEFWFQPTVGAMPRPGRVVGLYGDGRIQVADTVGEVHVIGPELVAEF